MGSDPAFPYGADQVAANLEALSSSPGITGVVVYRDSNNGVKLLFVDPGIVDATVRDKINEAFINQHGGAPDPRIDLGSLTLGSGSTPPPPATPAMEETWLPADDSDPVAVNDDLTEILEAIDKAKEFPQDYHRHSPVPHISPVLPEVHRQTAPVPVAATPHAPLPRDAHAELPLAPVPSDSPRVPTVAPPVNSATTKAAQKQGHSPLTPRKIPTTGRPVWTTKRPSVAAAPAATTSGRRVAGGRNNRRDAAQGSTKAANQRGAAAQNGASSGSMGTLSSLVIFVLTIVFAAH